jgi:hypothetical protein
MNKTIANVQTVDRNVNQLQQNIQQAMKPILNNPMQYGNFISTTLNVGKNVIPIGLQQTQQGWIIMDIDGAAIIYRSTPLNSTNLSLNSSAKVDVIIYVF